MITRTLLTVPYQVTRAPLVLVDVQLARRLPEDSRPRLIADRVLGSYDQLAGRLLDDPELARRGRERVTRTDKLTHAVELERKAAERRDAAAETAQAGRREAATTARQAQQRLVEGAEQADAAERDGKRAAAADARATAARKKQQAEQRTARRLAGAEKKVRQAETVATSRVTAARKTAKTKLDEAARERNQARTRRTDADQLAQLATTKRASRTKK